MYVYRKFGIIVLSLDLWDVFLVLDITQSKYEKRYKSYAILVFDLSASVQSKIPFAGSNSKVRFKHTLIL